MDSPSRPNAALLPKSPERINRLPQSPSTPNNNNNMDPFVASPVTNSVQGKVAQFNNLNKEASQKRKDNEAALRRAILGREEAENETTRVKEENSALRLKLDEARARDQRVAKKFEVFSEEKRKLIEHQHKVQKVSQEEVRRAKKEAFHFSSALVKAQEDLQRAGRHLEELNDQANIERNRGKKFQQEAFDAKLALSDAEDEIEALKKQLKATEEERDALRAKSNEEQVAQVAAEGRIPLPAQEQEDEFSSPRKSKARRVSRRVSSRRESLKENMDPAWRTSNDIFDIMWAAEEGDEFAVAKRNLWVEEKRRQEAEIMIKYLKAEYERKSRPCTCQSHPVDSELAHTHQHEEHMLVENSPMALDTPSVVEKEVEQAVAVPVPEDTILHHEVEHLDDEELPSPSIQSEPPPFVIHEDDDDVTPVQIEPIVATSLAPVLPSTSPSLLDLEAEEEKENPQQTLHPRVSQPRLSRSGINTAETSIISIKSEDVDDSEQSNSYPLTPRQVPNEIIQEVRSEEPSKLQVKPSVEESRKLSIERPPVRQMTPATEPVPAAPRRPNSNAPFRSTTTTTSVPLKGGGNNNSPDKSSAKNYPFSPGATMTREQALEAIKQRRRRAKSIHDGSKEPKPPLGELLRRDVSSKSAPA